MNNILFLFVWQPMSSCASAITLEDNCQNHLQENIKNKMLNSKIRKKLK